MGQEISFQLDSIHSLKGKDYEKIDLYNSLLKNWEKSKNYSQLGSDAHQLAKWIHKEKEWLSAIDIVKKAYLAREKATPLNKELLKRSYYNYAVYNYRYQNYSESIEYFEKLLKVDDSIFLRGRSFEFIGDIYQKFGDYYKSVEYQNKAITNHEERDIKNGFLITGYLNLAKTYRQIRTEKSSNLAIAHLDTAESLFNNQKIKNKAKLYLIKVSKGNLYCEGVGIKDTTKCIDAYNDALLLVRELDLKKELSRIHYNLGLTYIGIDSTKSNFHLNRAFDNTVHNPSLTPLVFLGKGLNSLHYKDYNLALHYFTKSLEFYFEKKENDE